mmetsp:Transcript_4133/g.9609  ORF Transcript_4133/g.9609 Transcript_4133/m.9609 type:complete len:229 (+) Transcript_4133:1569-2255(+)
MFFARSVAVSQHTPQGASSTAPCPAPAAPAAEAGPLAPGASTCLHTTTQAADAAAAATSVHPPEGSHLQATEDVLSHAMGLPVCSERAPPFWQVLCKLPLLLVVAMPLEQAVATRGARVSWQSAGMVLLRYANKLVLSPGCRTTGGLQRPRPTSLPHCPPWYHGHLLPCKPSLSSTVAPSRLPPLTSPPSPFPSSAASRDSCTSKHAVELWFVTPTLSTLSAASPRST